MKANILHVAPNFNLACGVSKNVLTILKSKELNEKFNLFFLTNGGDALYKLDKEGIDYSLINFKTNKVFQFNFLSDLQILIRYCKEKQIDIIHSHHRYPAYLSDFVKKRLNIKTVVTVHNFAIGFKSLSYKTDSIIAISQSVKKHLKNYFNIAENKVIVLFNCLSEASADTINKDDLKINLNIPIENKIIFYAGRIIEEKGITSLIDAFNSLLKDNKSATLVLVGECKISKKLLSEIRSNHNIRLIQPTESLVEFYKISDVVVLPSFREPFGYIMLEAGYYKKPFIGSKAGGIAEFIADGLDGFLFEPGNVEELKNKISYVLTHSSEVKEVKERLYAKVMRECNCEKYFQKMSEIYSNLL